MTSEDLRSETVHFTNFSILWFRNCLDNKGSICDVDPNYTSTYTPFMVFAYGRSNFERDKMVFCHFVHSLGIKRLQEVL